MSWVAFGVLAWIVLGLELGLRELLQLGAAGIAPSFVLPLMVFVALWAPTWTSVGAAMLLGLLLDLVSPVALEGGGGAVVVGPHVLGMLLGAALVLNLRQVVIRRNPLTQLVLTILAGGAVGVVVVFLHAVRALHDPIDFAPAGQLFSKLGTAGYSGLSALALSLVLFPLAPLFQFEGWRR